MKWFIQVFIRWLTICLPSASAESSEFREEAILLFQGCSHEVNSLQDSDKRQTFYRRTTCLLCDSSRLQLALPLAPTPIGNDYVLSACQEQPYYSLNLFLCADCGNVQVEDVVDPELLFRSYTYSTAHSLGLVEHFRRYAAEMLGRLATPRGSLVIDIGSNDGSLLRAFKELGMR